MPASKTCTRCAEAKLYLTMRDADTALLATDESPSNEAVMPYAE